MPRVELAKYSRPKATPETQTFVDPLHPEVEIEMTLKALDPTEQLLAFELAQRLTEEYIGDPKANPPIKPRLLFPPIDGKPVRLSMNLFLAVASLHSMQASNKAEDVYSVEQLVELWLKFPTAFDEIGRWAKSVGKPKQEESKGNELLEQETR